MEISSLENKDRTECTVEIGDEFLVAPLEENPAASDEENLRWLGNEEKDQSQLKKENQANKVLHFLCCDCKENSL